MADHLGSYNTSSSRTHVGFQFTTNDGSGGAVAPSTAFEAADLVIYRAADGAAFSATQRSSASGVTMTSPFDSVVGLHSVDIDLTDNTDAGFYAAGYRYAVVLSPDTETVDSQTVVKVLAYFEIGPPQVNVTQVGGTTQTARDIGASVLLSSGTGTGQVLLSSGKVSVPDTQKVDVETIKTNPVVNAGTVTFPTTATLASTTNITAGTITTVTNLTNAPSSGDFTATMKTSIGTAVAASAVASVTGNVGGSVASVATGGITSASFAAGAITASAIAADAIGASELAADAVAEIAAGVWDLATSGHTTSGTFGAAAVAAGGAGDPWSTSLPGSYGAGTAGYIVGTNLNATVSSRSTYAGGDTSGVTTLLTRIGGSITISGGKVAATMGSTDYSGNTVQTGDAYARLGAPAGASVSADVAAVKADSAAVLDDTGTSGVVVASASKTGYSLAAAGMDSVVIETGLNARQSLSVIAAALTGVLSGAASTTVTIKGAGVATTRVTATVDSDGDRSAVTLNLPT